MTVAGILNDPHDWLQTRRSCGIVKRREAGACSLPAESSSMWPKRTHGAFAEGHFIRAVDCVSQAPARFNIRRATRVVNDGHHRVLVDSP